MECGGCRTVMWKRVHLTAFSMQKKLQLPSFIIIFYYRVFANNVFDYYECGKQWEKEAGRSLISDKQSFLLTECGFFSELLKLVVTTYLVFTWPFFLIEKNNCIATHFRFFFYLLSQQYFRPGMYATLDTTSWRTHSPNNNRWWWFVCCSSFQVVVVVSAEIQSRIVVSAPTNMREILLDGTTNRRPIIRTSTSILFSTSRMVWSV